MIWLFGCSNCGIRVSVYGDQDEIRSLILEHPNWVDGLPCFTEGCSGTFKRVERSWAFSKDISLSAEQFFRALCGGGTPEEIQAASEVVVAFLLSARVVKVDARPLRNDGRTVIDRIYLDNGTVLHFSGTGAGALVYKVTRYSVCGPDGKEVATKEACHERSEDSEDGA